MAHSCTRSDLPRRRCRRRAVQAAMLLCLECGWASANFYADEEAFPAALAADDACLAGDKRCSVELLQLRGLKQQAAARRATPAATGATSPLSGGAPEVAAQSSFARGAAPPPKAAAAAPEVQNQHHKNAQPMSVLGFSSLAEYEAYEATIDDVIEESFKGLKVFGGYLESAVQREDTWRVCTELDWTRFPHRHTRNYDQLMRDLHVDNACDAQTGPFRKDGTCIAIQAAADAMMKLQDKFPAGPKFANYLVVDWGSHPSWRTGAVEVDNSVMPPTARVMDRNAMNGYGFCDLVRTIVTQSPNQMQTGTCGFVASLAALSHAAPGKTIKMALRLMWTGRPTRLMEPPCEYIFDLKPGLVPFVDESGKVRPAAFGNKTGAACAGSDTDCAISAGRPAQNAGLSFMWSQSLIASFSRSLTGSCPKDGPAKLLYPGLSREGQSNISAVQGQTAGSSLWACNAVIDPMGGSCTVAFNHDTCGTLNDNECQLLVTYQIDGLEKRLVDDAILDKLDQLTEDVNDVPSMRSFFDANKASFLKSLREASSSVAKRLSPAARKYATYMDKLLDLVGLDTFFVTANVFIPSADEALLKLACLQPVSMLAVDATPLQGPAAADPGRPLKGPFEWDNAVGRCNHMVYLERCDAKNNVYTLWTWGTRRYVTKELLLGAPVASGDVGVAVAPRKEGAFNSGIICFATYAKQISWGQLRGDPRLGTLSQDA